MVEISDFKELSYGVYLIEFEDGRKSLATRNLVPGVKVYDEKLIKYNGVEYRLWSPYRSKLAAAIMNGMKIVPINKGHRVLYLGIASGTTASHISDIIGKEGIIYGIEFANRPVRDLIKVAELRKNIVPLLKDARLPQEYSYIGENVDLLYEDVAQPFQSDIFVKNAKMFLSRTGQGLIAIKARSIDVTKPPEEIFEEQKKIIESQGFIVEEEVKLDPYSKDHVMFRVKPKK
jgi:fibrillarin-like pre-rRNA processing protein